MEAAVEGIDPDANAVEEGEGGSQALDHLGRFDQFPPVVRALGEPAEHVFRAEDSDHQGRQGPIDGGHHHEAARADQLAASRQEGRQILHVLHHLHVEDRVELGAAGGQGLHAGEPIVQVQATVAGMEFGDVDILGHDIDARDPPSQTGEGLTEDAAAATNVQQALASQGLGGAGRVLGGQVFAQVRDPEGIELVQGPEGPIRVPPAVGQLFKVGDLGGVDARGLGRISRHGGQAHLSFCAGTGVTIPARIGIDIGISTPSRTGINIGISIPSRNGINIGISIPARTGTGIGISSPPRTGIGTTGTWIGEPDSLIRHRRPLPRGRRPPHWRRSPRPGPDPCPASG